MSRPPYIRHDSKGFDMNCAGCLPHIFVYILAVIGAFTVLEKLLA